MVFYNLIVLGVLILSMLYKYTYYILLKTWLKKHIQSSRVLTCVVYPAGLPIPILAIFLISYISNISFYLTVLYFHPRTPTTTKSTATIISTKMELDDLVGLCNTKNSLI